MSVAAAVERRPLAAERRDVLRDRIVLWLYVYFFWIIVEGALRKWVFYGSFLENWVILTRDVIAVYLYFLYFVVYKKMRFDVLYIIIPLLLFSFLFLIQSFYHQQPILIFLMGIRNSLFHIPIFIIVANAFSHRSFVNFISINIVVACAIAVLCLIQHYSPPDAFVNRSIWRMREDLWHVDHVFTVARDVVRTYGPFTFTLGNATYAALLTALCAMALNMREFGGLARLAFIPAVAAIGLTSGSRAYFVHAGLTIAVLSGIGLARMFRAGDLRPLVRFSLFALCLWFFLFHVYDRALDSITERFHLAAAHEGGYLWPRLISTTTGFIPLLDVAPAFGHGVGMGGNAARYILEGERGFALAEDAWGNHVLEFGAVLGLTLIALRIGATIWLGGRAAMALLRGGPGWSALLFSCVGPLLLIGPVNAQNTVHGFFWFSLGLFIFLLRMEERAIDERLSQRRGAGRGGGATGSRRPVIWANNSRSAWPSAGRPLAR